MGNVRKPSFESNPVSANPEQKPLPILRLSITGVFMGLANLVPGVSGGTMVLALGLYNEFIDAMASVSRLKLNRRSLTVLVMLFGISLVTIMVFAGVIQYLMEMFKPGMLALFIGMTLGGAPSLYKELKPLNGVAIGSLLAGLALMASVALLMKPGLVTPGWLLLFVGGIIASSAMILPGISGSYMLLVLGLYLPIIGGVSEFKDALKATDVPRVVDIGLNIGLPVALGIAAGLIGFSSLLKFLLQCYHKATLGFLLGLLLGSVLGLYPFQSTSFDKLPRYGTPNALTGKIEIPVLLYGTDGGDSDPVRKELAKLPADHVSVRYLPTISEAPDAVSIELARAAKAVVIVYDQPVAKEVRRAAGDKKAGKVELVMVPNAEFTPVKAVLVVLLVLVGLVVTLLLGRLGGGETKKEEVAA